MQYISKYNSPLGEILIAEDEIGIFGLRFQNQKCRTFNLAENCIEKETEIIKETKRWLSLYFEGKNPNWTPPLHLFGTQFQIDVWKILKKIPSGKMTTYGNIAEELALKRGIKKMSAQAVGGAVGKNKILLILPCHRVIGANGNLAGYAGGIDRKLSLLRLEGISAEKLFNRP